MAFVAGHRRVAVRVWAWLRSAATGQRHRRHATDYADNRTRASPSHRLAVNLGFSIGPVIGGLLATFDFRLLFVVDAPRRSPPPLALSHLFRGRRD